MTRIPVEPRRPSTPPLRRGHPGLVVAAAVVMLELMVIAGQVHQVTPEGVVFLVLHTVTAVALLVVGRRHLHRAATQARAVAARAWQATMGGRS